MQHLFVHNNTLWGAPVGVVVVVVAICCLSDDFLHMVYMCVRHSLYLYNVWIGNWSHSHKLTSIRIQTEPPPECRSLARDDDDSCLRYIFICNANSCHGIQQEKLIQPLAHNLDPRLCNDDGCFSHRATNRSIFYFFFFFHVRHTYIWMCIVEMERHAFMVDISIEGIWNKRTWSEAGESSVCGNNRGVLCAIYWCRHTYIYIRCNRTPSSSSAAPSRFRFRWETLICC